LSKIKREQSSLSATKNLLSKELDQKNERIKQQEAELDELVKKNESLEFEYNEFKKLAVENEIKFREQLGLHEEVISKLKIQSPQIITPITSKQRRPSIMAFLGSLTTNISKDKDESLPKRSALPPAIKEGFLSKQGSNVLKSWKKKWFYLIAGTIYFMKDKQAEVKGGISLEGCVVSLAQDQTKKSHSLSIHSPAKSKTIYLLASSQKDMDEWVTFINQAIVLGSSQ